MKNSAKKLLMILLISIYITFFVIGCTKNKEAITKADYWPTSGWKTSTPEAQGMDSEKLNAMYKYIANTNLGVHSLMVIRNGYVVSEGYYYPQSRDIKRNMSAMTMSVTSALVGMAIKDGYVKSVDEKVIDIFSDMEIKNMNDRKKNITVKHLLTMSAGLESSQSENGENPVEQILNRSAAWEPGKMHQFNMGYPHILSAIVQKTSGKTSLDYANEKLFRPLGISEVLWEKDPQGISSGSYGLYMKTEDVAKLGYLYLHKGKWEDKQLLPKKWIEESIFKHINTGEDPTGTYGFGYSWWQNRIGGYSARGFGGQYLFVLPEHNLVVVFTGGLPSDKYLKPENLVEQYILPSIKAPKPIEENKKAYEDLASTIKKINAQPSPKVVPKLNETAVKISGKTFKMKDKSTFNFEFKEGSSEAILHWLMNGKMNDFKVGLDEVYRTTSLDSFIQPETKLTAGLRGSWIDDNKFLLDFNLYEDPNIYAIEFEFDNNTLNVKGSGVVTGENMINTTGAKED